MIGPLLRTADLEYELPPGVVAMQPAEPRDSAKMLVVSRGDQSIVEHARVSDLPNYLCRGDLIVLNTTKVLPARLNGYRVDTGGKISGLFLRTATQADFAHGNERLWIVVLQGKHLHPGVQAGLYDPTCNKAGVNLTLLAKFPHETGGWVARVDAHEPDDASILAKVGLAPLPPYILKARQHANMVVADAYDRQRYQTVFARHAGSVAAPTASLHFTPALLETLAACGVARADVTLHVGTGTFRSIDAEFVEQHEMHKEWCEMSRETAAAIERARASGGRVICIGTTAMRTVESFAAAPAFAGGVERASLETRLLISPGYPIRWTDGLLTNFHLPRSTLLALVAGMFPGGIDRVKDLYQAALANGYRFFSYGDAMLILP